MINGFYDSNVVPMFSMHTGANTRGHNQKLRRPASRTNLGLNRFTSRIVTDWNSLPEDVVNAESINSFKNKLDEFFNDDPSVYNYDS